jgi:Uma2 family endonuclease
MAMLITDPQVEAELIADRQARGIDLYDEVWEGVYVMSPIANDEHQGLAGGMVTVLTIVIEWPGHGKVRGGVNVSDRRKRWMHNFRVPDVAVFLNDTTAVNCGTHWYGGPDFGVEITSPGDRTREKFEFYAKVKTRELLIVDRDPWQLELYRLSGKGLLEVGRSTLDDSNVLTSEVVPLTWQLIPGASRPQIRIARSEGSEAWVV